MTALDLRNIASVGGNIVVEAGKITSLDLKNIAYAGSTSQPKAKLVIKKQTN